MSERVIDDFTVAWTADGSGLWQIGTGESAAHLGEDGVGLWIDAGADSGGGPGPYAETRPAAPADLRDADELRLWIRSDRPADGTPARPFYLAFEADTDPPAPGGPWQRLVPIGVARQWEMVSLWLGDMPAALRAAVAVLRLCGLDRATPFRAQIDDLVAVRPEPVLDLENAVRHRLHHAFTVLVGGVATPVPAVVSTPDEPPGDAPPYLLIIPWKVLPLGVPAAARDAADNFTGTGMFLRPPTTDIQVEYALDVVATDPDHRAHLRERLLDTLGRRPRVVAAGIPVALVPFDGDTGRDRATTSRRTPLFLRAVVGADTGDRRPTGLARPFVLAGPAGPGGGRPEPVRI